MRFAIASIEEKIILEKVLNETDGVRSHARHQGVVHIEPRATEAEKNSVLSLLKFG
jgi:hypothetical protein